MDQLVCTVDECSNATVIHVQGDVDVVSAPQLRQVFIEVLAARPSTHLVVDLAGVQFMDSTGIGVMVGAHKRVTSHGGWFTVVVTTPMVRRLLQVTGLLRAWRVTGSVEDALNDV